MAIILLFASFSFAACQNPTNHSDAGKTTGATSTAGADSSSLIHACKERHSASDPDAVVLNSTLSDEDRAAFFHLSQGSELFPVDWLLAARTRSGDKFFDPKAPPYGLLADHADPRWNVKGLAVGMTTAPNSDLGGIALFGFTCAACHVGEVHAERKAFRILGAPSTFDIDVFLIEFATTLGETVRDSARLLRFVDDLHRAGSDTLPQLAHDSTRALVGALASMQGPPSDTSVAATLLVRVDELREHALSPSSRSLRKTDERAPLGDKLERALAPAQDDTTELEDLPGLRGVARSEQRVAAEELLRNVQITLGLFANPIIAQRFAGGPEVARTFPGPGRVDAFGAAHNSLFKSDPPWELTAPVDFPRLWGLKDFERYQYDGNTTSSLERNLGEALGLGASIGPDGVTTSVQIKHLIRLESLAVDGILPPKWPFTPPDEAAVRRGKELYGAHCNKCHEAESGTYDPAVGTDANRRTSFTRMAGDRPFYQVLEKTLFDVLDAAGVDPSDADCSRPEYCAVKPNAWSAPGLYLTRSLAGVWATAPYLHNGSVPSLAALLQLTERPDQFVPGGRQLDLESVGFCEATSAGSIPRDTSQPGNGNGGHVYGTTLPAADKRALIAYLTTL